MGVLNGPDYWNNRLFDVFLYEQHKQKDDSVVCRSTECIISEVSFDF